MREFFPLSIISLLGASISTVLQLGNRFSVLTGGDRWMLSKSSQLSPYLEP